MTEFYVARDKDGLFLFEGEPRWFTPIPVDGYGASTPYWATNITGRMLCRLNSTMFPDLNSVACLRVDITPKEGQDE